MRTSRLDSVLCIKPDLTITEFSTIEPESTTTGFNTMNYEVDKETTIIPTEVLREQSGTNATHVCGQKCISEKMVEESGEVCCTTAEPSEVGGYGIPGARHCLKTGQGEASCTGVA